LELAPGVALERRDRWNAVVFERPRPVLSSAPVGGGDRLARRVVNLCVHGPGCQSACDDPEGTFAELAAAQGWQGPLVGLMTGVSASHVAIARHGVWAVLATAATGNAHRAGAPAPPADGPGTINIVAVTGRALTAAARAEALALAAEAKAALLADLGIRVPDMGGLATGTGTDAIAIAAETGGAAPYTGYHTASGQALVAAVREAVAASLEQSGG
jgi:adenosylcobinamide amidohydrolase